MAYFQIIRYGIMALLAALILLNYWGYRTHFSKAFIIGMIIYAYVLVLCLIRPMRGIRAAVFVGILGFLFTLYEELSRASSLGSFWLYPNLLVPLVIAALALIVRPFRARPIK